MENATPACATPHALAAGNKRGTEEIMNILHDTQSTTHSSIVHCKQEAEHTHPRLLLSVALDLKHHIPPGVVPLRLAAYMLGVLSVAVPASSRNLHSHR